MLVAAGTRVIGVTVVLPSAATLGLADPRLMPAAKKYTVSPEAYLNCPIESVTQGELDVHPPEDEFVA
jgi:hypothetical protein